MVAVVLGVPRAAGCLCFFVAVVLGCLFVPRWRTGCLCRLLRAAGCCGLAPNLLKRFSRPCSPFTTALDGARSRRLRSRTSGVCASPAAFYGSIRIVTGAAATGRGFELGDARTSFCDARGNQGKARAPSATACSHGHQHTHWFGTKPLRQFCQSYATAARHTAAQQ